MDNANFRLACGLYEQVELWSMRRTAVKVVYETNEGLTQEVKGIITDVYVKSKVEYIQMNANLDIVTSAIKGIEAAVIIGGN